MENENLNRSMCEEMLGGEMFLPIRNFIDEMLDQLERLRTCRYEVGGELDRFVRLPAPIGGH